MHFFLLLDDGIASHGQTLDDVIVSLVVLIQLQRQEVGEAKVRSRMLLLVAEEINAGAC